MDLDLCTKYARCYGNDVFNLHIYFIEIWFIAFWYARWLSLQIKQIDLTKWIYGNRTQHYQVSMISCENEDTSFSTVQQTLIQSTDLSYYEQYDVLFILLLNAMTTDIYYLRITILEDYIHKKKT